jgi:formylglycine-generating enzyme required for sulfatase activity
MRPVPLLACLAECGLLLSGCAPSVPPEAAVGDTWVRPADHMVMMYVPAGEFQMGSSDAEVGFGLSLCAQYGQECERWWFEMEQPAHTVELDAYWIDQTEVRIDQYDLCVKAGECYLPVRGNSRTRQFYYADEYSGYPVIWVAYQQAEAYCEWAGGRLPTEAEWEYAARGPEGRLFPWGDEFDGTRLNYCDASCAVPEDAAGTLDDGWPDTALLWSYPGGASWCGALDMAGNVSEWVADWYGEYTADRQTNPLGPESGEMRVMRGGGWRSVPAQTLSSKRGWANPQSTGYEDLGFRCVVDMD